jgi:hypothetical protein
MTTLINSIYGTGEWSKDFTEITIALRNKPQTTKCSYHRTIGLTAHTANTLPRNLEARLKGKLRMYSEISLDLEEGKELGMQLGC